MVAITNRANREYLKGSSTNIVLAVGSGVLPEGACPTREVTVRKAVEAGTMHWERETLVGYRKRAVGALALPDRFFTGALPVQRSRLL